MSKYFFDAIDATVEVIATQGTMLRRTEAGIILKPDNFDKHNLTALST